MAPKRKKQRRNPITPPAESLLVNPLLRVEFGAGVVPPEVIRGDGFIPLRDVHYRFVVQRLADSYKFGEISQELFKDKDKKLVRRIRHIIRKIRMDAAEVSKIGVVDRVLLQGGDYPPTFVCLLHGCRFTQRAEANNHCWVTLFDKVSVI